MLLVGSCGGAPACTGPHTYLFVDGLDVIARSDSRVVGFEPARLLRPGGPLYPADVARWVSVAAPPGVEAGVDELALRIGLRGGTVVWSELMYPGRDSGVVEEVRFPLGPYMAEIQRAYVRMVG
ncbi:hypothetical protein [Streptomyces sp. NPDC020917]|uniref:hypothetical protein n=1 Tax=Streptomyces sp. NPDC020917 TaxID=3365102 RepID=UPI0037A5E650